MKIFIPLTVALIVCGLSFNPLFGQEMLDQGVVKLTEVAKSRKYGYHPQRPIKAGSVANGIFFLNALKGPYGEPIQWEQMGNCCEFRTPNALVGTQGKLDRYQLIWPGIRAPLLLYINPFDYEEMRCPYGLTFLQNENLPQKERDLKAADYVERCDDRVAYSVPYPLLENMIEDRLTEPGQRPAYQGGPKALKSYFSQYPLRDKRAEMTVFRVHIGFMINCNGKAGNFQVISRGKGFLDELADQILDTVKNMPQKWVPGDQNGQSVDCYQVLSFTVSDGNLEQVSYQ